MQNALVPREEFPILSQCNYLASHSLGAMPAAAKTDLARYADIWAKQGILAWEGEWWEVFQGFSAQVEAVLGAASGTVVPCLNVSLGFAAVAGALNYRAGRTKVVMGELEFTTTAPFWKAQEKYGAELVVVPSRDGITVPCEDLIKAIDEQTALVVSSHAYFRSGALQDLNRLQQAARRQGALLLVDAYQSVGCVPLNVREADFDFLVGGCHKWLCGGPGGGFLYVRPELIGQLEPSLVGWFALSNPFSYDKNWRLHEGVQRFLNGTPNVLAFFAARAGLQWVLKLGLDRIRQHSLALTDWLRARFLERGLSVRTPDGLGRNGMLCLDFDGAKECQVRLQQRKVIVDYRGDCGLRISPHFYNQLSDLEEFCEHFDRCR